VAVRFSFLKSDLDYRAIARSDHDLKMHVSVGNAPSESVHPDPNILDFR
jgi:hypothetical protein